MTFKRTENCDPGLARQLWLQEVTEELRERFHLVGYQIPDEVRASIGFPSAGLRGKAIGECWATEASTDAHAEIFLIPTLDDPARIVDVLAHELVHATVGHEAKHGKVFRKCALAIGLEGKMTSTVAGEAFKRWIADMLARIGEYPAGSLNAMTTGRTKQKTRLLKAECGACGYTVRVTRKWVEEAGAPHCPHHGEMEMAD